MFRVKKNQILNKIITSEDSLTAFPTLLQSSHTQKISFYLERQLFSWLGSAMAPSVFYHKGNYS